MSVTFSTGFHQIKPGLRVSGDEISVVFVGTYDSGLYTGKKYIHIDLTNEPDLTFVEAGVAGPLETVADVDALYTQLKDAGMTEAFEGFLVDPSDLSSIHVDAQSITFDFAGHQPYIFSRNPDANVTERTKVSHQTWSIPQVDFAGAATLFGALESPEEVEFVSIENRLGLLEATNGLIKEDYNFITLVGTPSPAPGQVGVTNTVPSLIDMIVLPSTDVDGKALNYGDFKAGDRMGLKQANGSAAIYALSPTLDMGTHFRFNAELLSLGYYGDQEFVFDTAVTAIIEDTSTRTSAAAVMGVGVGDTDFGAFTGTTVADGSTAKEALQSLESGLETTIASLAGEATTRETADTALDGRVTALESDPTTAAAVAAGDAATLSSANSYTDTAVSNVIGSAPGVLDTLGEIADAINDDANVYTTIVSQINAVQADVDGNETDGDAADAALSGRLDTLEVDPTTATAVQAVQDNLDTEAGSRASADSALDGRIDVLEADPTTATAVAAVQSDVDQNESDSDAADAALSGRLDVLEADPTTATAVAAVQSDVDQNETDSDAADAALSGRLDVLEADPTTATAVAAVQSDVDQNEADADAALALRALLDGSNIPGPYADDTAAAAGGVAVGALYKHNNGQIHYRVS